MNYETFVKHYLRDGLLKTQRCDFDAITKLILRAQKELEASVANLNIDEGIAYSVAYTAMLRAGRALMQAKGFRPAERSKVVAAPFRVRGSERRLKPAATNTFDCTF